MKRIVLSYLTSMGFLVGLAASAVVLITATGAHASTDPAFACAGAKQKAAARLLSSEIKCYGITAETGGDPTSCLQTARATLDKAFRRAEAKGGCVMPDGSSAVTALIDAHATDTLIGNDPVCGAMNARGAAKLFGTYTKCVAKWMRRERLSPSGNLLHSCVSEASKYLAGAKSPSACETADRREQLLSLVGEAYTKLTAVAPPAACPTDDAGAIVALLTELSPSGFVCGIHHWTSAYPRPSGSGASFPAAIINFNATFGVTSPCDNSECAVGTGWSESFFGYEHPLGAPEALACAATTATWLSNNTAPCDIFADPAHTSAYDWKEWPVSKGGNGHRYALTKVSRTWYECRDEAIAAGGHLATINDAAENAWLYQQFGMRGGNVGAALWIGFNDLATEGHWEWVGGDGGWWENQNPASTSYVNWYPGTPEPNGGVYENAAFFGGDYDRAGSWTDAGEDRKDFNGGIIEIDVP